MAASTRGGSEEKKRKPAAGAAELIDDAPEVNVTGKALDARIARLSTVITSRFPEFKLVPRPTNFGVLVELPDQKRFVEFCEWILNDLDFDHSSLISGVDWLDRFEAVYHFWSNSKKLNVIMQVPVDRNDPHIPSVTRLWKGANYHERETYDMFGIKFDGHPDLRRIYLEENYEFFPQRKDFKWGLKYG